MAPVVMRLDAAKDIDSKLCVTAQHRQMLDQVLDLFGLTPDYDLNLMTRGQDLFDITARSMLGLRDVLRQERPDRVLVHGDTTTCFTAALAAFYENIAVGHVEAGLRTGNLQAPFPEEANRALVGRLASYHFAPTEAARRNLLAESVADNQIWVTGNTVIDALLTVRDMVENYPDRRWIQTFGSSQYSRIVDPARKLVLITGHRRENFGQGLENLCKAIQYIANSHPDWDLIYPVHLNPNVQRPVYKILAGLDNVFLIDPLDYAPFVWLMSQSDLVLTDSGGIQEEAPALGKPVLVMREVTERPEAVEVGTVLLVGTDRIKIVSSVEKVLTDTEVYKAMSCAHNPYGDGHAASRIVNTIVSQAH